MNGIPIESREAFTDDPKLVCCCIVIGSLLSYPCSALIRSSSSPLPPWGVPGLWQVDRSGALLSPNRELSAGTLRTFWRSHSLVRPSSLPGAGATLCYPSRNQHTAWCKFVVLGLRQGFICMILRWRIARLQS